MQDEKRVESVSTPAEAVQPKKTWQKPHLQQLRISLDTAFGSGSIADGLGGSTV